MFQLWGIDLTPIKIACVVTIAVVIGYIVRKYYVSQNSEKFNSSENVQNNYEESYQDDLDDLDNELEQFNDNDELEGFDDDEDIEME